MFIFLFGTTPLQLIHIITNYQKCNIAGTIQTNRNTHMYIMAMITDVQNYV